MIVQWARSSNDRPRGEYRNNNREFGRGGGGFRGGRGGGGSGGGPRSNECFNCHERGHIARDCRKGPSNGSGGGGRRDNGGRRKDYDSSRSYRDKSRRDRSRSRSR
jgi:hypothetical protein